MKNKFLLLFIIAAMWQTAKAGGDTDTAWVRIISEDIVDVKFSPDSKTIATAHDGGAIRLWETATGINFKTLKPYSGYASAVAFSNDGKFLYTAEEATKFYKFDLSNDSLVKNYISNPKYWGAITNIYLSNDNSKLFIGLNKSDSTNILVLDEKTGNIIKEVSMVGGILKFILSPDNKYFAAFSNGYDIKGKVVYALCVWDAVTYKLLKSLDYTNDNIGDIAFSADGTQLYEVQNDTLSLVKIWDIQNLILLKSYKPLQVKSIYKITPFKLSNNSFILFGTFDFKGGYGIYNIVKDDFDYIYNYQPFTQNSTIAITIDETKIAIGGSNKLDLLNNKMTGIIETEKNGKNNSDIIIPNPIENKAIIKINIPVAGIFQFLLFNESGMKIGNLYSSFLYAGPNEISLNLPNIPNGNYLVSVKGVNFNESLKLSIVR